jgi:uncharacterized protein DUF6232
MDAGKLTPAKKAHLKTVRFPAARIMIDDKELRVGNQSYPLDSVWEVQLWNEGQPAHLGFWLWPIPVEIIAVALGIFFKLLFIWVAIYTTVFVGDAARRLWREFKRAEDHALMIDTGQKWVQIYSSPNYLYLRIIERAINKAVRNYILEKTQQQLSKEEQP